MALEDIAIVGTGGVGRYVIQALRDINEDSTKWNVLGFLDDDVSKHGQELDGFPILGPVDWIQKYPDVNLVVAVADPLQRKRIVQRLSTFGHRWYPNIVHPTAWIASNVEFGEGNIIYPGVTINFDVRIGNFDIVNMQCAIGHEVLLEDFVTVSPGVNVGGNVRLGEGVFMGIGSSTVQGIEVGDWTVVGGGAMVIRDLPKAVVAVGVPARPVKTK